RTAVTNAHRVTTQADSRAAAIASGAKAEPPDTVRDYRMGEGNIRTDEELGAAPPDGSGNDICGCRRAVNPDRETAVARCKHPLRCSFARVSIVGCSGGNRQ